MRTGSILGQVALAVALSGLVPGGSAADDLVDFFPNLAARGVPVPVEASLSYSGGGVQRRFTTAQGFGSATANFTDLEALTTAGDAILNNQNLPISSAVSAFTFTFDPSLNVFTPSTDAFGPIFSERAETTGRGKIDVGFSFAHVDFDIFEGERLNDLDITVEGTRAYDGANASFAVPGALTPTGASWSIGGGVGSAGTAGGTISQGFTNSSCGVGSACAFSAGGFGGFGDGGNYQVAFDLVVPEVTLDADIRAEVFTFSLSYGITDRIDVGVVIPYLELDLDGTVTSVFPDGTVIKTSSEDSASGLGDVILRGKIHFLDREHVDLGARFDVFLPTGDEDDLRGFGDPAFGAVFIASGSWGIFSPHANVGVLLRGGGEEEHAFRYTLGTDIKVHDRVSLTTDLIAFDQIEEDGVGDFQWALGTGVKWNPWRRLVVSASALWKLNESGLRARVIPSLGLEYTF